MILETRDLSAGYGRLPVLHGVSIALPKQGAIAILGPNGAGKSTLLKVLARRLPVMGGEVRYRGDDYGARGATWAARNGIALVPQDHNVFPDLTVAQNLRLGAEGKPGGAAAVEKALAAFPVLRERAGQLAGSLSGGERQIVAITSALLMRPEVLLLDEPTTGLAPQAAQVTAKLITDAMASGTAVAWVVEQMPELALERVQRAYFLEGGQIRFDGEPADLLGNDRLEELFLQRA
jgi:ABC-type branched-subunit amino acid transport system ATPase component